LIGRVAKANDGAGAGGEEGCRQACGCETRDEETSDADERAPTKPGPLTDDQKNKERELQPSVVRQAELESRLNKHAEDVKAMEKESTDARGHLIQVTILSEERALELNADDISRLRQELSSIKSERATMEPKERDKFLIEDVGSLQAANTSLHGDITFLRGSPCCCPTLLLLQ